MPLEPGDLAKLRLGPCSNCGAREWKAGDQLAGLSLLPERNGETTVLSPLVPLRCGSCGLVLLFSPDAAGLRLTSTAWPGRTTQ